MLPKEVIKRCDENTIGVVSTLGVTYTLQYEPVQEVAVALDALEGELRFRSMWTATGFSRNTNLPPAGSR